MKIVIDARELRTSSGRYVERLLNYLQLVDKENNYLVLLKPKDMNGWSGTNPNFEKIACSIKEFSFAEQIRLRSQIKSLKPDLVHFTFPQQPVWYKGKTVTTIHDLTTLRFNNPDKNIFIFKFKQKVYSWVIKRVARKANKVVVPSKFVKNDLINFSGINPDKIVVTYEAADPISEPAQPIAELNSSQFIMYVGRPTPHKNLGRLIDAYVSLKRTYPELKLVLAGKKDSNYRTIEASTKARGIDGVYFTDFISDGQLKWLYQNCLAYVFPSLSEGFGLPGLEAMLNGAAVVCSNETCLPEIYANAAAYFDPLSVGSMSEAIGKILQNQALRQELIKKGLAKANEYSWEHMAKQTLKLYIEAF